MPVILQPKDYDRWLTPGDPARLPVDLLRPFPAKQMTAWKVDPNCIEPMSDSGDEKPSLFA
jgi:putative SOS response-associated peptidase YedK